MKFTRALLVPLFVAAAPLAAQEGDPLKSSACASALENLQAARSSAGPGPGTAGLEQARAAAAGACLGSALAPARPSRLERPPEVVPPPQVELPRLAAPLPAPVLPPPPVAIQRPPLPAPCDTHGCWMNDGSHLRHVPPGLAGPGGPCVQQRGLMVCP